MSHNPMVSCVMCTYGRYTSVCRAISFFLNQDYKNKELIIFNTAPVEMFIDPTLKNIIVVNQQYCDNALFKNIGQVRSEAMKYISGDIYSCWDDDDFYMPFHLSQSIKHLLECGLKAWKPKKSLWSNDGGVTFEEAENNMEASILVKKEAVHFDPTTGDEHIGWLGNLRSEKQILESDDVPPSYCYVWGDPASPHKQSGDMSDLNRFETHKKYSTDFGQDVFPADVREFYQDIYFATKDHRLTPYI